MKVSYERDFRYEASDFISTNDDALVFLDLWTHIHPSTIKNKEVKLFSNEEQNEFPANSLILTTTSPDKFAGKYPKSELLWHNKTLQVPPIPNFYTRGSRKYALYVYKTNNTHSSN